MPNMIEIVLYCGDQRYFVCIEHFPAVDIKILGLYINFVLSIVVIVAVT